MPTNEDPPNLTWLKMRYKWYNHVDSWDLRPIEKWVNDLSFWWKEFKRYHFTER